MDQIEEVKVRVLPGNRVDRANAAKAMGRTPKTLAHWKSLGIGPRPIIVGGAFSTTSRKCRRWRAGKSPLCRSQRKGVRHDHQDAGTPA